MRLNLLRVKQQDEGRRLHLGPARLKISFGGRLRHLSVFGLIVGLGAGAFLAVAYRNLVVGLLLGVAFYVGTLVVIENREHKKSLALADQFDIFLVELNGALVQSMPIIAAVKSVLYNTPDPLRHVVAGMLSQYAQGLPIQVDRHNKDLGMFIELVKLKDAVGGDINNSLARLAEKVKKSRSQREELAADMKGSLLGVSSQYVILAMIMAATYNQQIFQDLMVESSAGRLVMTCVAGLICISVMMARRVVKY